MTMIVAAPSLNAGIFLAIGKQILASKEASYKSVTSLVTSLRSALSPVHAQTPRSQRGFIAVFGPRGQNWLDAGKDVDGHHFRGCRPLGTYHNQGITRFQLSEIEGGRALQHLLHIFAGLAAAFAGLRACGVKPRHT